MGHVDESETTVDRRLGDQETAPDQEVAATLDVMDAALTARSEDTVPLRSGMANEVAIDNHDIDTLARHEFQENDLIANRFTILKLLGNGAMGAVYKAHDTEMNTVVALKTILPDLRGHAVVLKRFKREIQVARLVTSRNVCRIFDIGYHLRPNGGTTVFVTMEYLEGEIFSAWLFKHAPLDLGSAIPLIRQMAEGLEATHEKGIIHRDFKSANIILVPKQGGKRVVITDFGIARLNDPESDNVGITIGPIGTPDYMAPEQVEGREPTPATDVYALGVVIYEMLTGHRPYTAANVQQLMFRRVSEPPTPPQIHNPTIDPAVAEVILKCLEREQDKRYQSAAEVVTELVAALDNVQPARSLNVKRLGRDAHKLRSRRVVAGGIVAVALGLTVAISLWQERNSVTSVPKSIAARVPVTTSIASALAAATPILAQAKQSEGDKPPASSERRARPQHLKITNPTANAAIDPTKPSPRQRERQIAVSDKRQIRDSAFPTQIGKALASDGSGQTAAAKEPSSGAARATASISILPTSLDGYSIVGREYRRVITAVDGQPPYTWSVSSGLPLGLAFDSGVISGSPSTTGDFKFTVSVTDSSTPQNTAWRTYALTVAPNSFAIITRELDPPGAIVGKGYGARTAVTAVGGVPPYAWSATGLPNGMGINSTTGAVFGFPTEAGTFNFTVTVRDSSDPPRTVSRVISVVVASAAPSK